MSTHDDLSELTARLQTRVASLPPTPAPVPEKAPRKSNHALDTVIAIILMAFGAAVAGVMGFIIAAVISFACIARDSFRNA